MVRLLCLFFMLLINLAAQNKNAEQVYFDFALSLMQEERFGEALENFQDFIELYPQSPLVNQAYEKIAEIHIENRNYQKALKIYKKLAERSGPNHVGLRYLLLSGRLMQKLGYMEEALKIYQQIIFLYPNSPNAHEAEQELKQIEFRKNLHLE